MAHHTTHRRNLAAPLDPKPSMDLSHTKHPISTTTTTTTNNNNNNKKHHHPQISHSTIQTISNHFSKLYPNHKILTTLKSSTCHSQAKPMALSPSMDNSCTTLTKSKSQHGRHVIDIQNNNKYSTRSSTLEKVVKVKVPFEVHDIEKALMKQKADAIKRESKSKNLYCEELQNEEEGGEEVKRSSFSLDVHGGGGRRRRSFCSSQTELSDFFSCNGVKVVSVDMPPFMQVHVVDCARKAYDSLEKFTARTLAYTLKKEFDGVYGPAWHCIVGTSFGSFVTHSVGGFMYFSMDHKIYVLLFKTTVQKAAG